MHFLHYISFFSLGTCTTKSIFLTLEESNLLHPNKMYNQNLSQHKKIAPKVCAFDTKKLITPATFCHRSLFHRKQKSTLLHQRLIAIGESPQRMLKITFCGLSRSVEDPPYPETASTGSSLDVALASGHPFSGGFREGTSLIFFLSFIHHLGWAVVSINRQWGFSDHVTKNELFIPFISLS